MLLRTLAVALVAMCPLLASQTGPQLAQPAPQPGQSAPDFTLTDSTGSSIKLSAYKGKVVLLDFWATWCGGCKVETPWYVEFQNKYRSWLRSSAAAGSVAPCTSRTSMCSSPRTRCASTAITPNNRVMSKRNRCLLFLCGWFRQEQERIRTRIKGNIVKNFAT